VRAGYGAGVIPPRWLDTRKERACKVTGLPVVADAETGEETMVPLEAETILGIRWASVPFVLPAGADEEVRPDPNAPPILAVGAFWRPLSATDCTWPLSVPAATTAAAEAIRPIGSAARRKDGCA
jgi:hypothetical protein